ncbi:hypothetical protein [Haliscomenobacter hydrossis]|uniref:hypothetical protein n=1 Tax=Haliscomenobacter hydrossis TaxID=2350 RepID=UPI0011D1D548|nr:hypothetical protein [Haliscomenobacter hydrossis]
MWLIEWKKRASVILGFTAFSMLLMFGTILLEAQKLRLSPPFFTIHFCFGIFILIGIQIATLFPEWRNLFQSCQYLQTPATTWEKYITRLSFPFLIAPGIYIAAFLLCRPLSLQFSLMVKDFMPHPMYSRELIALVIGMSLLVIPFFTLFIPGSIWLNRSHLIKSAMLYLALFFTVALISAMLGLPMYDTTREGVSFLDRMFAAQFQGLALFLSKYSLIWLGIIGPVMVISGYYLLKYREV